MNKKKAVLLLSGGLDSCTILELLKKQDYQVYALTFSYGQRHRLELEAVKRIIERSPVAQHQVITLDLRGFGKSALTSEIEVPSMSGKIEPGIPVTYVPARNIIFLSYALAYAETVGAQEIFVGSNLDDSANYPDCRSEFLAAFERMARLGTAAGVQNSGDEKLRINGPLLHLRKTEVVQLGISMGLDYSDSLSCYNPSPTGFSCARCLACTLRLSAFQEAKQVDLIPYQTH